MQASWHRLDDGSWGVKLQGDVDETTRMRGEEVRVRKRDGGSKLVRLGRRVSTWNGGRSSVYEVAR